MRSGVVVQTIRHGCFHRSSEDTGAQIIHRYLLAVYNEDMLESRQK